MVYSPAHPVELAQRIFDAADEIIRIQSIGSRLWKRNVQSGARIGPWRTAEYEIVNSSIWKRRMPCLYMVAGNDLVIRYVGISRNRLKDRWRESPALDADTMIPLPTNQLFHSQCWRHVEREGRSGATFTVRCIGGEKLLSVIEELGPPLSGFAALRGDWEGIVAAVERWLCNNKSPKLVSWNQAMTISRGVAPE